MKLPSHIFQNPGLYLDTPEAGDPTVYAQAFDPNSPVVTIPDGFQRTSNALVQLKDELAKQSAPAPIIIQNDNSNLVKILVLFVAGFLAYKFILKKGK